MKASAYSSHHPEIVMSVAPRGGIRCSHRGDTDRGGRIGSLLQSYLASEM